ncbi:MAG: hypothetical protein QXH39_05845 [Conexivisphaerales archaeon]
MMPLYAITKSVNEHDKQLAFIMLHIKNKCIRNERIIELIALQTLQAFKDNELLARRPDMDFILRISLTDQIKNAQENCLGNDAVLYIYDKFDTLPFDSFSEAELDIVEQSALLSTK